MAIWIINPDHPLSLVIYYQGIQIFYLFRIVLQFFQKTAKIIFFYPKSVNRISGPVLPISVSGRDHSIEGIARAVEMNQKARQHGERGKNRPESK